MDESGSVAERRFAELAPGFESRPGVTAGTGFGASPGLRVGGRIFAMVVRDQLVVKLPKGRVDELVDQGSGVRFDRGRGTPMKEWLALPDESRVRWDAVTEEAFAYVGGG